MTNLPSITEKIGHLTNQIEADLIEFESGGFEFRLMVWHQDSGMVVPYNWINDYPDWAEEWHEFMDGQTVCGPGIFYRDVIRFLNIIQRRHGENNSR